MKKFFEKYDLIKLSGIVLILSVLLTWVVKPGSFQNGAMTIAEDLTRVDFQSLVQNSVLGIYYFPVLVTFLLVLGGFYQVLSKRAGYQAIVKGISKKLKGHETVFVVIISTLIALWTSMALEYIPVLVFIPFIITILNRLKVDKISAFSATFGSALVGILGSVYSAKFAGVFTQTFTDSYIIIKWILLAVALILLNVFTVLRMKKNKETKEYDLFEIESVKSDVKQPVRWTYAIMLILICLTTILAFLPWSTWKVEIFTKATEWVNSIKIAGVPIFSYIFGEFHAFGAANNAGWSLFSIEYVLVFATLLMHWIARVSLSEILESIGEGMKKMVPLVIITLVIQAVLIFSYNYGVIPTITDWIAKLSGSFNVVLACINAFIGSVFYIEPTYVATFTGAYYAGTYAANADILAIIFQAMYGLAAFFVPTSMVLYMGLSYMNISYADWMKHIWKYLLAMLLIIIVIVAVMSLAIL